jgi:ABC-type polysaccharide/polyol phosphate export permease
LVSYLMNFLLTFIPFFLIMTLMGYLPSWETLLVIPVIAIFSVFIFGFCLILTCLNVYFRDVSMFWSTLLPALFYATPVVYQVPDSVLKYMKFNPFYHFMELIREVLYWNRIPDLFNIINCIVISLLALLAGLLVYSRLRKGFISYF